MKVCFVVSAHPKYRRGGSEIQFMLIAKELIKKGFEIHMTTRRYSRDQLEDELIDGIHVHSYYWKTSPFSYPLSVFSFFHALRRANCEVYHQRGAGMMTFLVSVFCKIFGKKFVFTAASLGDCKPEMGTSITDPISKFFYKIGLESADKRINLTDEMKNEMKDNLGVDSIVIRSGHKIPPSINKKQKTVLWIGRIDRLKKPEKFIDLANSLKHTDWKFKMICECRENDYCKSIIANAKLAGVCIIKNLEFNKTPQEYEKASILINTSSSEGFPNTFIQAWLAGTPVVSTVDPDNFIKRKRIGLVAVSQGALKKSTVLLMKDKKRRIKMGKTASEFAKRTFNIQDTATNHELIYKRLNYDTLNYAKSIGIK